MHVIWMTSVIGSFDRTGEFRACVQSFHQRVIAGRAQLNPRKSASLKVDNARISRCSGEFLSAAHSLTKDLQLTLTKLRKLTLMLDREPEAVPTHALAQLIDVIQCDIVDLNKAVVMLHTMQKSIQAGTTGRSSQLAKHHKLMIQGIEYRLSYLMNEFRRVLEKKKDHLSHVSQTSEIAPEAVLPGSHDASVQPHKTVSGYPECLPSTKMVDSMNPMNPQQYALSQNQLNVSQSFPRLTTSVHPGPHYRPGLVGTTTSSNTIGGPTTNQSVAFFIPQSDSPNLSRGHLPSTPHSHNNPQQSLQQQLQLPILDQEVRQRDAAMKRVESTIVQLGEIYQQFSSLVREQGDLVTRIDSQTEEAELNIGSAHEQLLSYLRSVSTRRAFMIKVFVAIFLCFLVFAWIR